MKVTWNNTYSPEKIIERINDVRIVSDQGEVKFADWRFREHVSMLRGMLDFSEAIPELEAGRIVYRAVFAVSRVGKLDRRGLIAEINRLAGTYSLQEPTRFVLATSVSVRPNTSLPRIRLEDSILIFEHRLAERFRSESSGLLAKAKRSLFTDPPSNYLSVRVHVWAKSPMAAADKAIDTLDLVRGIWNWLLTRGRFRESFGGGSQPANSIVIGPLHTLHHLNGTLATETWWYDRAYVAPVMLYNLAGKVDELYQRFRRTRRKLLRNKLRSELEEAFVRYARALDERNLFSSYRSLWGILELLTNTSKGRSKDTIRRTSFIHTEPDYHRHRLNYLKELRNRYVHADKEDSDIEIHLYSLKFYVDFLLSFLVWNSYGFYSMSEAAAFLSLPTDVNALRTRVKMATFALKYLGYE